MATDTTGYELDRRDRIWVDHQIVGQVRRNTWGRAYAVWVAGESGPHLFDGNSAFATEEAAAHARAKEVRRGQL